MFKSIEAEFSKKTEMPFPGEENLSAK